MKKDNYFLQDKDKLEELFKMQEKLQKRLGYDLQKISEKHSQKYFNLMFIAIIEECVEIIRETPWKPWKKSMTFNQVKLQEEVIDLWHFIINLSIASGLTPQKLYDKFVEKNTVNHKRQDNGY